MEIKWLDRKGPRILCRSPILDNGLLYEIHRSPGRDKFRIRAYCSPSREVSLPDITFDSVEEAQAWVAKDLAKDVAKGKVPPAELEILF